MAYDFCLSCGILLASQVYSCPVCGFTNSFDEQGDLIFDDLFITAFDDEFPQDSDSLD